MLVAVNASVGSTASEMCFGRRRIEYVGLSSSSHPLSEALP